MLQYLSIGYLQNVLSQTKMIKSLRSFYKAVGTFVW